MPRQYVSTLAVLILFFIQFFNVPNVFGYHKHSSLIIPFSTSYLVDTSGKLSIKDIQYQDFKKNKSRVINLGFNPNPCWIKIDLSSNYPYDSIWNLKILYPVIDSLTFYYQTKSGVWNEEFSGELLNNNVNLGFDRVFTFPFVYKNLATKTVYIKVVTQGSVYMPLEVEKEEGLSQSSIFIEKVYGSFFGALLVMICFNLVLYLFLKDIKFLYYSIFIFFSTGVHYLFTGHHLLYFPQDYHIYSNHILLFFMYSTNIFALLFSIHFLDIKTFNKRVYVVLVALIIASVFAGLIQPILQYRLVAIFIALLFLITPTVLLITGIISWRSGHIYARYFILSWFFFLFSVVTLSLRTFGLFQGATSIEIMVQAGTMIDVILLGVALADRYNNFKLEKDKVVAENLRISRKMEQNALELNKQLEIKINERTLELEQARQMLIDQNKDLKENNDLLEDRVSKRTSELSNLVNQLQEQVSNVEQYSFVISHNLRAPIARILGLSALISNNPSDEENSILLRHIDTSAKNLDVIVRELNHVLEIKKGKGTKYELVDLNQLIEEFKVQNEILIKETNAIFLVETKEISAIYSIRFYLMSILYNLFINAIKYRHPLRNPEIAISTFQKDEYFYLTISDNGNGFDMDNIGDKVFKLYQRFDLSSEGRGLGLYMVKTQVEFLKGTISLSSVLGEGSVFEIKFPLNQN